MTKNKPIWVKDNNMEGVEYYRQNGYLNWGTIAPIGNCYNGSHIYKAVFQGIQVFTGSYKDAKTVIEDKYFLNSKCLKVKDNG